MDNFLRILGARGSVPVSGAEYAGYGGATTCVLLRLGGRYLVLDAGTGLLRLPEEVFSQPEVPLLLSHPHADHLLGLPLCPGLLRPGAALRLYAKVRNGLGPREQVERLLSPPLWPVGPEALPGSLRFSPLPDRLSFGPVSVETMEGVHPGGVSLFRLSGEGKTVVFLTDCTLRDDLLPAVEAFARGCDLLLCDGQYSPSEWEGRKHFGHSTWLAAARLGKRCGAGRVRVIHHDPGHGDALLDAAAPELLNIHPACSFAREGEVIEL